MSSSKGCVVNLFKLVGFERSRCVHLSSIDSLREKNGFIDILKLFGLNVGITGLTCCRKAAMKAMLKLWSKIGTTGLRFVTISDTDIVCVKLKLFDTFYNDDFKTMEFDEIRRMSKVK